MNLTFSASYVGKLLVFDDSAGGRTPASTREQEMWDEILRLRAALAQMKERAAQVADKAGPIAAPVAAGIRALPVEGEA